MSRLLKAIVVEDDIALCHAFAATLNADSRIEAAESHNLAEATRLCELERQVVLVVDLGLPDARGVQAIVALRKELPGATLVVISGDETLRKAAIAAGAHAFILKASEDSVGRRFVDAVRAAVIAHNNEQLFAPAFHVIDRIDEKISSSKLPIAKAL